MSAFVVEDQTINSVVTFLANRAGGNGYYYPATIVADEGYDLSTDEGRRALGEDMFALNCRAVDERYGAGSASEFRPLDYSYSRAGTSSKVAAFKALGCWKYQCSEGLVPESKLYRLMRDVYHAMAVDIVHGLPAYEKAPWG